MRRAAIIPALLLAWVGILPAAVATTPPAGGLQQGARLALCGDSITEQMIYTRYVEAYLLACAGRGDVSVFQFGWGGENADQFGNRIRRGDLDAFRPTAITFLYGANDGGGMAWQDWMQGMWTGRITGIIDTLATRHPATTGHAVIAGPTYIDVNSDGSNAASLPVINDTLGRFRDLNVSLARERGYGFADIRQRMAEVKAAAGPGYRFGGNDGGHAGPNGQLMMAFEILRAFSCDGAIGTITVDLSAGATATPGHQVLSAQGGVVRLRSSRWPFCYAYDGSSAPDRMETVLPWLPFSQDLNRLVLVARNLAAPAANVTWGAETRTFTAAQLAAGVNLAGTFTRTPFDPAFAGLMERIAAKQEKERAMIKAAGSALAETKGWTDADVVARDALDAQVHAAVVPVEHEIRISPVAAVAAPPVVAGAAATGRVGQAFSQRIVASNAPTTFAADGLPAGLACDPATGTVSGTPTEVVAGRAVTISAGNPSGTGTGVLTITIAPALPPPVVSGPLQALARVGTPFLYRIAAGGSPSKFYATGLPAGLGLDAATGVISGTPTAAGVTAVLISAENGGGNGPAATLRITVAPPGGD